MKTRETFKNTFSILCSCILLVLNPLGAQYYYEDSGREFAQNENNLPIENDTQACTKVLNETCCNVDEQVDCNQVTEPAYEHWLLNRKILLVGVPVLAGGIAVALASSSNHNVSYFTGYPYYSYSAYYDHSSHSDSHKSEHKTSITPLVKVESMTGSVTLTATIALINGTVLDSNTITLVERGTYTFGTSKIQAPSEEYQITLSYILDALSTIRAEFTTYVKNDGEEVSETTPFTAFSGDVGSIVQTFSVIESNSYSS